MVVPIRKRHVVRGFKRNPKNGITECGCINECHWRHTSRKSMKDKEITNVILVENISLNQENWRSTDIFTSKQIMDYLIMIWNSNWRKNLFGNFRFHLNRQNLVFQFHEKNQTKQRRYKSIEKHQQENIKSSTSKKKMW